VQKLAFINGFRALAALWVVVGHVLIWSAWRGPGIPSVKLAVDLFIIISGYLMMLHAHEREAAESMQYPSGRLRFYIRRFFRIAPVYYLSLACAIAFSPIFLGGYAVLHAQHLAFVHDTIYDPAYVEFTPYNVFLHLTFLFGLLPDYAFSTFLPDWSLGLEMQFYAVFPLLYLFMRKFGWQRMVFYLYFPCQFIAIQCAHLHGMRGAGTLFVEPSFLPLKLHYFMVGMLIARTSVAVKRHEMIGLWSSAIAITLAEAWMHGTASLIVTGLVIAMLHATTFDGSWLRSVMDRVSSTKPVSFLSRMSYAAYLFHGFIIAGVGYFLFSRPEISSLGYAAKTGMMLVIVLPATYGLSWIIERYIEVPGITIGGTIIHRRAKTAQA